MKVYIGADHRGFHLKEQLKPWLIAAGYSVEDVGNATLDPADDYPHFAGLVGQRVSQDADSRGIVLCGSGVGVDIAANKISGVRSALGVSIEEITSARKDDNINVLALGADFVDNEKAKPFIQAFLQTVYTPNERFERRLTEISQLEESQ